MWKLALILLAVVLLVLTGCHDEKVFSPDGCQVITRRGWHADTANWECPPK
jgi:hypothetical protein